MSARYDDPASLASMLRQRPRPLLLGLDIDGVLAPLVDHADDAVLLDGVADAVAAALAEPDTVVAAVSGRALSSIKTFGLPAGVRLVGSHGMEVDGGPPIVLDADEIERLERLHQLTHDIADGVEGAWVEHKVASVVLHVRTSPADAGTAALDQLTERARDIPGAFAKPGSNVLELFARAASKGTAIAALTAETDAATTVFVGDDVTDEEAFAALRDDDVSIKVGDAATTAAHRLADPAAVLAWLRALPTENGASEQ